MLEQQQTLSRVQAVFSRLRPYRLEGMELVRAGSPYDGGYVVPEVVRNSNFVMSIGIGNDCTFELECAERGAEIFLFDHTIEAPPAFHPRFHFRKIGWGPAPGLPRTNLTGLIDLTGRSEQKHPILKFDVEGSEWAALETASPEDLAGFDVIVAELHGLEELPKPAAWQSINRALDKLLAHHEPVHLHANNCAGLWNLDRHWFPEVVEITLLHRKLSAVGSSGLISSLHSPVDRTNQPYLPHFHLSFDEQGHIKTRVSREDPSGGGRPAIPREFGINLIATFSRSYGIGYVAANLARSLIQHQVPTALLDVRLTSDDTTPSLPLDLKVHLADSVTSLQHPINLYVLPIPMLEMLMQNYPGLRSRPRLHVVNLWWEITRLPEPFARELARHDLILAHSDFIAGIAVDSLPLSRVINARLPWPIPHVAPDRGRFGLPDKATIFMFAFDANAGPERKNPIAVVKAFLAAFARDTQDVCLAVRVNYAATPLGEAVVQTIRQVTGDDARVRLILEPLDYQEILILYASSDVYISPHRGEGFGLGMHEAMALGKAVVATGWSGNLSFMDNSCACLMRYRMVKPNGNYWFHHAKGLPADAVWAEPVIEDMVAWMQILHHDRPLRSLLGHRAQQRYAQYQSEAAAARWIDELIALQSAWPHLPAVAGRYSTDTR